MTVTRGTPRDIIRAKLLYLNNPQISRNAGKARDIIDIITKKDTYQESEANILKSIRSMTREVNQLYDDRCLLLVAIEYGYDKITMALLNIEGIDINGENKDGTIPPNCR